MIKMLTGRPLVGASIERSRLAVRRFTERREIDLGIVRRQHKITAVSQFLETADSKFHPNITTVLADEQLHSVRNPDGTGLCRTDYQRVQVEHTLGVVFAQYLSL